MPRQVKNYCDIEQNRFKLEFILTTIRFEYPEFPDKSIQFIKRQTEAFYQKNINSMIKPQVIASVIFYLAFVKVYYLRLSSTSMSKLLQYGSRSQWNLAKKRALAADPEFFNQFHEIITAEDDFKRNYHAHTGNPTKISSYRSFTAYLDDKYGSQAIK